MNTKPFREDSLDDFLSELGSAHEAPGGGAVAALLGAEGCALAEKVCRFTLSNKKYESVHQDAEAWLAIFTEARSILLDLMDEDAKNFTALMETYRLPKDTEGRADKIEAALQQSAEAPIQTAQLLSDMMELFTKLLHKGNQNLLSDAIMACQCAMAAVRAAILNVRVNLKYMNNEFYKHDMEETIRTWENAVSGADAVLTYQVTL